MLVALGGAVRLATAFWLVVRLCWVGLMIPAGRGPGARSPREGGRAAEARVEGGPSRAGPPEEVRQCTGTLSVKPARLQFR